jgi:hypothetical protein
VFFPVNDVVWLVGCLFVFLPIFSGLLFCNCMRLSFIMLINERKSKKIVMGKTGGSKKLYRRLFEKKRFYPRHL